MHFEVYYPCIKLYSHFAVHSASTCTHTVMHHITDGNNINRKQLLASSVGTMLPPMLQINCNEEEGDEMEKGDRLIYITGACNEHRCSNT